MEVYRNRRNRTERKRDERKSNSKKRSEGLVILTIVLDLGTKLLEFISQL